MATYIGPCYSGAFSGSVVTSSDGTIYAIFGDSGLTYLDIYKKTNGSFSRILHEHTSNIFGTGWTFDLCAAAMRSDDDIALVVFNRESAEGDGWYYAVFDTGTETCGSWTKVESLTTPYPTPVFEGLWVSTEADDDLHILAVDYQKDKGTTYHQIVHIWQVSGSWQSMENVSYVADVDYSTPRITLCPNGDLEAFYHDYDNTDAKHRRKNGTWGTEGTYSESVNAAVGGVTCTTGDTVYRVHAPGSNIEENDVDTGFNGDSPRAALSPKDGTTRYIIYRDAGDDIHAIRNDGSGWVDEGDVDAGTWRSPFVEWAYNHENQEGQINVLFCNSSDQAYWARLRVRSSDPAAWAGIHRRKNRNVLLRG